MRCSVCGETIRESAGKWWHQETNSHFAKPDWRYELALMDKDLSRCESLLEGVIGARTDTRFQETYRAAQDFIAKRKRAR